MRVLVTGIGVVSAIGNNVNENLQSLVNEQCGIREVESKDLKRKLLAATVDLSNEDLLFGNESIEGCSRTSLLGLKAAKECWANNQFSNEIKTGIISGTSVGGMDKTELFYRDYLKETASDFSPLQYHDSGNTTEVIANALGKFDYVNTLTTACSSGSNAIMQGARLIQAGVLDRVLVGGTDALTQFTISGFTSLMIYNEGICQPFDENRNGLNLGEGAAFLLLESETCQKQSKNEVLGEIKGWGNTADAFHQTATSPDAKGAVLAMNKALKTADLKPETIGYVNAHGTGTKNNDLTESIALQTIFNHQVPPFSSTKSFTGHTLAASGAIEAVYSILALKHQKLFPNLHFESVIEETGLTPVKNTADAQDLRAVLSNSFGFGGNCTSLVITGA